ncbi:MAG TPA: hypothetical protein VHT04_00730 [Stellaceae bacterium]|jgi:hypothetical protein|nr:hypothetical protein [Stellaceae bacterium]
MTPRGIPAAGLALALTFPLSAVAQQDELPSACGTVKGPFAGLIRWVVAEGSRETLPATILGLPGDGEVAVFQKAYRNPATHLVHAVDVNLTEGRCDAVFIIDDVGAITTWVTDAAATIVRTFHAAQGGSELVPNDRYVSEYETAKAYFLERVPERYSP